MREKNEVVRVGNLCIDLNDVNYFAIDDCEPAKLQIHFKSQEHTLNINCATKEQCENHFEFLSDFALGKLDEDCENDDEPEDEIDDENQYDDGDQF